MSECYCINCENDFDRCEAIEEGKQEACQAFTARCWMILKELSWHKTMQIKSSDEILEWVTEEIKEMIKIEDNI